MAITHRAVTAFAFATVGLLSACGPRDSALTAPPTAPPHPTAPATLPASATPTAAANDPAIAAFWQWWQTAAPRVAQAIDARRSADLVAEINSQVDKVHPDLAWELGPGMTAKNSLTLSAEGDPELRVVAERWLTAAPPADANWQYFAARQAQPLGRLTLQMDEVDLPPNGFAIAAIFDDSHGLVHLKAYHPNLHLVSEKHRLHAVFLLLDGLLGEDNVERWLGGVEIAPQPLADGVPLAEFLQRFTLWTALIGRDHVVVLRSTSLTGTPVVATVNVGVKRVDHLLLDQHVKVTLDGPSALGGPPLSAADLETLLDKQQAAILAVVGSDAVFIASEQLGRQRLLHLHAAASGPVEGRLRNWLKAHGGQGIGLSFAADPRWEVLQKWR